MKYITETEAEQRFDEFLNEIHDSTCILGMYYTPAHVLFECDPTAYSCELANWLDSEGLTTDEEEADDEEEGEDDE